MRGMATYRIRVRSRRREELVEFTDEVRRVLRESGASEGVCHLYVRHTTAGLTVNENADPDDAAAPEKQDGKTEDERAAEAFSAALNDALRKPLAGETRALAVLTRIECTARGLVFVVRVGDRLLRLSAKTFEEVHMTAFTPEAGGQLTCGPRKPESQVVVTYRAGADARAKTDGTLAALEFVPANFQLKQ